MTQEINLGVLRRKAGFPKAKDIANKIGTYPSMVTHWEKGRFGLRKEHPKVWEYAKLIGVSETDLKELIRKSRLKKTNLNPSGIGIFPTKDPSLIGLNVTRQERGDLKVTQDGSIIISHIQAGSKTIGLGTTVKLSEDCKHLGSDMVKADCGVVYRMGEPQRHGDFIHVAWIRRGKRTHTSSHAPEELEVLESHLGY